MYLRELRREDARQINAWRESRNLISTLGAPYRFIGPEIDDAWFDSYLKARSSCVRCVVVEDSDPITPVALVTIANIDWINRSCEFHIMVGEAYQGRGVGKYATKTIIDHAFNDLGLRRIELGVLSRNNRALSLYKSAGFVVEGNKRAAIFKDGEYEDLILMALLKEEWEKNKPSEVGR